MSAADRDIQNPTAGGALSAGRGHDAAEKPVAPILTMAELRKTLDIRDGVLHYKIYDQDDAFVDMTCADTASMCRFVEWVRMHDRKRAISVPA